MKLNNFSDFSRVIIIDDKEDEGLGIKEALESIQIPSLFYHVISNRSLDNKLCKNVRLVFLDLIFNYPTSNGASQNAGVAISRLSKVVDKTGFYILVLWSSHTTEEVAVAFHEQMKRQTDFAKPYIILALQKTDYKLATGKYKIKSIIKKINDQLAIIPSLQVFSDWERLTTNSVSEITANVVGNKTHDELSKVINSLSIAYAGKGKPRDKPQNALMAFNEIFRGEMSQKIMSNSFGNLYKKIGEGVLDDSEKAKLNTALIFTPDTNLGPGSIFKIALNDIDKEKFISDFVDKSKNDLGDAYEKMMPIAVEITPLCSAAQAKNKHAYFLCGLIHPVRYSSSTGAKNKVKIKTAAYLYSFSKVYWEETNKSPFKLTFNLNLFHSKRLRKYISTDKKLRDNFVIDLQHQISGYISRPGHVLL